MIRVSNLVVKYRWRQEPILKNISINFDGKYIVLGPNGSGKTTLFRAIAGLTPIEAGEIYIDDIELSKIHGRPRLLSVNLEEIYRVLNMSAYDHIRLYMDLVDGDLDLAFNILGDLGIETGLLRKRKPWELSAGQKKAFSTAMAIASKANNILLDEPFEQLDPARKIKLLDYLYETGSTILINTHETWLIPVLKEWSATFMFEGRIYGPIKTEKLLKASVVRGETGEALLTFQVSGRRYSIIEGEGGRALTELTTLDKIYELAMSDVE